MSDCGPRNAEPAERVDWGPSLVCRPEERARGLMFRRWRRRMRNPHTPIIRKKRRIPNTIASIRVALLDEVNVVEAALLV